jgi:DNA-directed RNA polymerase subunit N (RpoN/RPB10)
MAAEEWEIQRLGGKFRSGRFLEEVGVKRACCGGGRRQMVPEDSKSV